MNQMYSKQFGALFITVIVLAFRPGPTRANNVQADVQLIFNENSTKPIPASTEIVNIFQAAITNPNSGFNLTVDAASITVTSSPQTIPVIFLTNGTFSSALSNSSSDLFTNRSLMIKSGLVPFFVADFPYSFSTLTATNYSDGGLTVTGIASIWNYIDLSFGASATLPNSTQIGETIIRAARNNTLPFQIFTSKIIVNGTVISAGDVSSKINVFTASFLVAMSLLVTWSR
ncbi:hypothetical protein P4O66_012750 [Electrophorus voltai]|uniref:Uncharacterized protein n=1 Tax=Electrophorus voltai TaxID=2609070 RepID=A0AAD8Z5H2_9TELE|nr:hypothetical protein P4O66_012750 [Electrophorus voltai]